MKPFLKWAGGKARLVSRIAMSLPRPTGRLIEPFVGSAAVFLGMQGLAPGGFLLGDANPDLIRLYRRLASEPAVLIGEVEALFVPENRTPEGFYRQREAFNALEPGSPGRSPLMVYLNRHAFNGLHRVNRSGGFNVPWGQYVNPPAPIAEMLAFSRAVSNAEFVHADFEQVMRQAREGDVVYCDPPYVPLTPTASFSAYAADRFCEAQQRKLADLARELSSSGIPVLISNHDTPFSREIYEGALIETLSVRRSVSASSGSRKHAAEILAAFHVPGSLAGTCHHYRVASGFLPGLAATVMAARVPPQAEIIFDYAA